MKKILIVLFLSLCLFGCGSKDYKDIMKEKEYVIVDVRTESEYEKSHIVGSINIPYNEIGKGNDFDKEKVIFVYCQSGNRSKMAYETLTNLGYTVYDLGAFDSIALDKE